MTTARRRRLIAGMLAVAVSVTGCSRGGDEASDTTLSNQQATPTQPDEPIVTVHGANSEGDTTAADLGVQLSEGQPGSSAVPANVITSGTPLDQSEIDAILDELPPWELSDDDESDFELPPSTLLPPEVGGTVDQPFPPPGDDAPGPPDEPTGPLQVLRYQPEGDVGLAPFVTATFSEPMVPIATLEQLDAHDAPMTITPEVEGRFRWIGTRTLRFEVIPGEIDRLPNATSYEVTVPAGTESANGAVLDDDVRWTFTTPTPILRELAGVSDSMPTDVVWVATFDQRVDAEAVLGAITVTVGGQPVELRIATDDDLARSDQARLTMEAALADRAVAFTPTTALPTDTAVAIAVGPDVPSAEGPNTSDAVERFSGRTFGALRVLRSSCAWGGRCVPGAPFNIEFSNELDPDLFDADLVTVEPAIPGIRIDVYGNTVGISGATRGQTSYAVTFDGDLTDVFGQRLGDDATVTFKVGSAQPELRGLPRPFITTDPTADDPTVSITTINHDAVRVRAWAVTPAQLTEFYGYLDRMGSDAGAPDPGWDVVMDETVEIDTVTDTYVETSIDLTDALQLAGEEVVVRIDSVLDISRNDDLYWANQPTVAWVQHTTLGVDAFFDEDELVIATNDLVTGEPVGGVPVELLGDGRVATTDEDGLATLELGDREITGLFANGGDRTALLPAERWGGWRRQTTTDGSRWYVVDDRGIYRPGETVHLTGWVRRVEGDDLGELQLFDADSTVEYAVMDAQGVDLGTGTADMSPLGGFTIDIELPLGTNLGMAWVDLRVEGARQLGGHTHAFSVQEFRRPNFEVTTRVDSPPPHLDSESATVAVDARYFSGAPLPDAEVHWLVTTRETTYSPPKWDDYTFGVWQPWWWFDDIGFAAEPAIDCFDCGPMGEVEYEEYRGRTDDDGSHLLQIAFDGDDVDLPSSVTAEATVFDVDRQAWSSRTDMLVHPASYYVGLRTEQNFVAPGTPIRIGAVVTDIDGEIAAGQAVAVTAGRVEWAHVDGEWTEQIVDTQTCTFTSSDDPSDEAMECEFATEVGGTYRVTAILTDPSGQTNRTEITQWVSGGTGPPARGVEQERVTIVPDKEEYAAGDTARLLVQAPFAPAFGTFTVTHHGILRTEAFTAEDGSSVIEIPIDEEFVPNVTVQVDVNGSTTRTDDAGNPREDLPPRPAFATGRIDLPVPAVTRTLTVEVAPEDDQLAPGEETSVTITVTDATGEPVAGAEVVVMVVDEAVLSLTGYELTDPIDVFYATLTTTLHSRYYRSLVLLASAADLEGGDDSATATTVPTSGVAEEPAAEESAADYDSSGNRLRAEVPIDLRSDFDPVAVYAPGETTAGDGTVTVAVPLPDNLTRYRVMAVAVAGAEQFGKGEASITARLPLMVEPSAPRFLNFGDRFEMPVVLHNQTDEPLEVEIAVQVANLELLAGAGKRVTVPANNRVEVRFPATTISAGTARLRVAAVSGTFADAVEFSLPVYTPATSEAFATYGVIDDGAIAQPLSAPTGVIAEYGGLEIGIASTALQALTDAVLYVVDYEYQSSDAYASRIIAVASLRDVLTAFDAEGLPEPGELDAQVASDITRLSALQNDDGGFPYWQRGRESIPWNSIQSTHALVLARDASYAVPSATLDAALGFIADIESHIPSDYSQDLKWTLRAYALYVGELAGRGNTAKAEALYDSAGDDLQLDALAWLWPSIADADSRAAIETRFTNSAVETAGAATFATDYAEDAYLIAQSDTRTDAVILDALITQTPDSDLIPKVVAGLNGRRTNGRWSNDQENSFVLVAMKRYFDTFEADDPSFVARAWIGDVYVAEAAFLDRTTERKNTVIPTSELMRLARPDADLILSKDGAGRLYYRLGFEYAPDDLRLDPRDEGFAVERTYLPVADDGDVIRDDDGTWRIKAGATVRVRVTMVADAQRTHVALVDPLPAGLEPINSALAVSQTIPPDEGSDDGNGRPEPLASWWWWTWFEHENLRDDRAEAFTTYLSGGTYEYSYLVRATTPGTFVTPPARAEEIYSPEVFGRTATDMVVVE